MKDLTLGSEPRFPAASKKRGMARAIEVVEWLKAYAEARAAECTAAERPITAEVFRSQALSYGVVIDRLHRRLQLRHEGKTRQVAGHRWKGIEDDMSKADRGFASMDREKRRDIAQLGGKAAHEKGTAHEWTVEEAREAGRKGGAESGRRRRETAAREEV